MVVGITASLVPVFIGDYAHHMVLKKLGAGNITIHWGNPIKTKQFFNG